MGKTVAISVGGSVILIAAANQAGIINVNWDKITKQVGDTTSKLESKITQNAPTLRTSVSTISTFQHYYKSITNVCYRSADMHEQIHYLQQDSLEDSC